MRISASCLSLFLLSIAGVICLLSCREKGPVVNFGNVVVNDTSYMAAVETPTGRRVMIEEYTGVSCSNCPAAAKVLAAVDSANPGRVVIAAYHSGKQTEPVNHPPYKSKYDFRNGKSEELVGSYFGENPNKPAACFDRQVTGSASTYFNVERNTWSNLINTRLQQPSAINLRIDPLYNDAERKVTVKITAAFTSDVNKHLLLNLYLLESGIVDAQENGINFDSVYVHKHIFRDFITTVTGASFLDNMAIKKAGLVYERTFVFELNNDWDPARCQLAAFINTNEAGDKEVLQAAEAELKP